MFEHLCSYGLVAWLRPALACAGLGLSGGMLAAGSGGRHLAGCSPGSGCAALARGRWGRWLGLPLAAPAAVAYAVASVASAAIVAVPPGHAARWASVVLLAMAPLLGGSALWFAALQALVVRRLCPYCLATVAVSLALAVVTAADPLLWQSVRTWHGAAWLPIAAGVAALCALVLGQLLVRPRGYEVRVFAAAAEAPQLPRATEQEPETAPEVGDRAASGANGAAGATAEDIRPGGAGAPPPNPFEGRTVVAARGRLLLPGGRWPVLGSPEARSTPVFLFEHTCAACRYLRRLLLESVAPQGNALAVVMVPVVSEMSELDAASAASAAGPEAGAAPYARLALAVWRADWRAYAEFDRFLFEGPHPPDPVEARRRAEQLVGRVLTELDDPATGGEIDAILADGIRLYRRVSAKRLPTLVLPHGITCGQVPTAQQLAAVFAKLGAAGPEAAPASEAWPKPLGKPVGRPAVGLARRRAR